MVQNCHNFFLRFLPDFNSTQPDSYAGWSRQILIFVANIIGFMTVRSCKPAVLNKKDSDMNAEPYIKK